MATLAGIAYVDVKYDQASIQKLRATTESEGRRITSRFSSLAGTATRTLTLGVVGGLAYGFAKSVTLAADFQKQLNILQAVSGATADQMHRAGAEALKLGADVKLPATSASDAAVAMTELAKGGLSVRDSMLAARGSLQLAVAGQTDVATAAQTTANALNAFGLSGTHAAHVADLLAGASNASSGNVVDFADGLRYAATASHAAGQSIDLTVAALAEMANKGLQGSVAGSALAQTFRSLQHPSAAAATEIHKLGLRIYDAHGNMLPLDKLATQFTSHLAGMTQKQRDSTLATLFGSRAIQGARIVLLGGAGALDAYEKKVSRAGSAQRLAQAQTKGFSGALQGLQSTAETLGIQVGLKLLPPLTSVVRALTSALPGAVSTSTSAVEAFGPPVGFLAGNFGTLEPLIVGVAASLVTLKAATLAASSATAVYGAITKTVATAQILLTEGTSGLAAAQGLQGNAAAIAAAENSAATAATGALAAAQTAYQAALEGTITAETATAIAAGEMTVAETAAATAASAAAAETGVLSATLLSNPFGLAALGISALVGGLLAAKLAFGGTATFADQLKSSMDAAKASAQGLGSALEGLQTGRIDLKQANLDIATSQEARNAAQRKVNSLLAAGKTGTKAYRDAVHTLTAAEIAVARATVERGRAQGEITKGTRQAAAHEAAFSRQLSQTGNTLIRHARASLIAKEGVHGFAVEVAKGTANTHVAHIAAQGFQKQIGALATSELDLAAKFRHEGNPALAESHTRTAALALAAVDLSKKIIGVPTTHAIDVYYKQNMGALINQANNLRTAIDDITSNKTINITTFYQAHGQPAPTHARGGIFGHASGGVFVAPTMVGRDLFGEAGHEAVVPLDSSYGHKMLAQAIRDAGGGGGDVNIFIDGKALEAAAYRVQKRTATKVLAGRRWSQ